jgi:hypothetical protein
VVSRGRMLAQTVDGCTARLRARLHSSALLPPRRAAPRPRPASGAPSGWTESWRALAGSRAITGDEEGGGSERGAGGREAAAIRLCRRHERCAHADATASSPHRRLAGAAAAGAGAGAGAGAAAAPCGHASLHYSARHLRRRSPRRPTRVQPTAYLPGGQSRQSAKELDPVLGLYL